jgi:hypothetical protein
MTKEPASIDFEALVSAIGRHAFHHGLPTDDAPSAAEREAVALLGSAADEETEASVGRLVRCAINESLRASETLYRAARLAGLDHEAALAAASAGAGPLPRGAAGEEAVRQRIALRQRIEEVMRRAHLPPAKTAGNRGRSVVDEGR